MPQRSDAYAHTMPRDPVKPDESRWVNPDSHPVLRPYLDAVLRWHGYIRFLGLPHLKDNPDVPIDRLFIEPAFSKGPIHPESYPRNPVLESLQSTLEQHRRLVLLGDPGSGKSTLLSYLAWQLARREESSWHGWLLGSPGAPRPIPVPMVLRELGVKAGITWDSLLNQFCAHQMVRGISEASADDVRAELQTALECGQALVMLDGLDEIGNVAVRHDLRQAVHQTMDRYPACRWLLTSRVVGYEEARFEPVELDDVVHHGVVEQADTRGDDPEVIERVIKQCAELRYVAPFSNDQIDRFIRNWFAQREPVAERASATAEELIGAIQTNRATHDLARIPNLLTLIALIYRVLAWLPNGRAQLYEKIAEAYLGSIDRVRKMPARYDPQNMKDWLGRVGFQMQLCRAADGGHEAPGEAEAGSILATKADVKSWMMAEMADAGVSTDDDALDELLNHLARRSGLLLPRGADSEGHDLFAFMHLSFMEYFAAWHISRQVLKPRWLEDRGRAEAARPAALREHAGSAVWRESLVFLFELFENDVEWTKELVATLFGEELALIEPGDRKLYGRVRLLAQLAVDRQSGLTRDLRRQAVARCVDWEAAVQELHDPPPSVVGDVLVMAEPDAARQIVEHVSRVMESRNRNAWSFACTALSDLGPLAGLTGLQRLDLQQTGVSDLGPLAGLTGLRWLHLQRTGVSDLGPLAGLTGLRWLHLGQTALSDLGPLAGLTGLQGLHLQRTGVSDLGPLAGLTGLQRLDLRQTGVSDLGPLAGLTGLRWLHLGQTGVSDLGPLAGLTGLQGLDLQQTGVSDLGPLAGLTGLQRLDLQQTGVSDLGPLAGLTGLQGLALRQTGVRESQILSLREQLPRCEIFGSEAER